jgi:transposase
VRVPRLRLPDGKVALVEPEWFGRLAGFTLLFEARVAALAREMPFAAVARLVGESWHRVNAICERYVELALAELDLSEVRALGIDETSCRRGHDYLTLTADAVKRRVLFVAECRDAKTVGELAAHLRSHSAAPAQIESVSIDMSPAFIKGVTESLPNARITFDKFHVVAHASAAVDAMRRLEQRTDPSLKGLRWTLLRDRHKLSADSRAELDTLIAQVASKRTARAWVYREQLREVLDCKQINVVSAMLAQWCTNVMRSKVEPMKAVARMIRRHFDGIVAWTQTRQTNGLLEAFNGLFQAAKRKARGYGRFRTTRTVIFLIAANSTSPASTRMPANPLEFQKSLPRPLSRPPSSGGLEQRQMARCMRFPPQRLEATHPVPMLQEMFSWPPRQQPQPGPPPIAPAPATPAPYAFTPRFVLPTAARNASSDPYLLKSGLRMSFVSPALIQLLNSLRNAEAAEPDDANMDPAFAMPA